MINNLEEIISINKHISILNVDSTEFNKYGKVLKNYDHEELLDYMKKTNIPQHENIYIASEREMESLPIKDTIEKNVYGGQRIQIGYCNGKNSYLNGLEYHKSSEINIAVTDLVLILGSIHDIKNNTYETKNVEVFYLPVGTAVELYQTTLHFSPCKVIEEGFQCVVILPSGTNEPLNYKVNKTNEEDELLFMKNKWLLCHPERKVLLEKGAYPGLAGENLFINYISKRRK